MLRAKRFALAAVAANSESSSVLAHGRRGQENAGVSYREGRSDTTMPAWTRVARVAVLERAGIIPVRVEQTKTHGTQINLDDHRVNRDPER